MLHIPRSLLTTSIAATLAIGVAACGGGGGGSLPTTGGSSPTQPVTPLAQNATANMLVNIPAKSASSLRNPKYISVSTQSMTIGLVSGGKTTPLAEADLTPTSPKCSTVSGGTQCAVSVITSAGQDTFQVSMYSQIGGKGTLLSTGNVVATLVANQSTTVPLVLSGVPASVSLMLGVATLPVGTASSTTITVQAQDGSGNLIIGPGDFSAQIKLAITGDTYKTLGLSTSTVTSPGQAVTLTYSGGTNTGATITPSGSGITGTATTFAGSGAELNMFQAGRNFDYYLYPYGVAALPNGQAAVILSEYSTSCCTGTNSPSTPFTTGIGIASATTGFQNVYFGNVTDPYAASPAPEATPGDGTMTYVPGMSADVEIVSPLQCPLFICGTPEGPTGGAIIAASSAANSTGAVYYTTYINTTNDTTNCSGHTEASGGIGVLTAGSVVERNALGYPFALTLDSSGNLWFLEQSGTCNGTRLLPDEWAIGELTSTNVMQPPVPLPPAAVCSPTDMSISPDGTSLYISDPCNDDVLQFATSSIATGPTTILQTFNAYEPLTLATASDGTTAWFSDATPGTDTNYYGYVPGTKSFSTANSLEVAYPINYYTANSMSAADQSFWIAGGVNTATNCCPSGGPTPPPGAGPAAIARISFGASGTPQNGYYELPQTAGLPPQYVVSSSAGGGYAWFADSCMGNIDVLTYGAPASGSISYSTRRGATMGTRRNPHPLARTRPTFSHRR